MKYTPWTLEHDDPIGIDELYWLSVYEGEDVVCLISADTSEDCLNRAKLIAASPQMASLLQKLVNDGWSASISMEAKKIIQTLD